MNYLSTDEQQFIQTHLNDNVQTLLLRHSQPEQDIKKLAAQIAARQKAKHKLPSWYVRDTLIFPPSLSVEQASSEATAHYKASLVGGSLLIDVTGGMGVDTWAFAQKTDNVIYIEQNPELAELAAHNLPLLGATNVAIHTGNGLDLLEQDTVLTRNTKADWLYIDPHRRDEQGSKVVRLADCEPDLSQPETIARLLKKANRILLKASPLLDVDATVRQLAGAVEVIHVVALQGEVKEVLFILSSHVTPSDDVQIHAVNLMPDQTIDFSFRLGDERTANTTLGDPKQYVYEPNAAVMKAGAFRLIGTRFDLEKLAPNSHLYTSDTLRTDFPGRIFILQNICKPDVKSLKTILPTQKANLTIRNFPQSVAELRKKLNLLEGGSVYILATTLRNGDKRLLITQKTN